MKIKIKITSERTYEPMLEFYENKQPLAVLEHEIRLYKDDPGYILQYQDTQVTVEGELIES